MSGTQFHGITYPQGPEPKCQFLLFPLSLVPLASQVLIMPLVME